MDINIIILPLLLISITGFCFHTIRAIRKEFMGTGTGVHDEDNGQQAISTTADNEHLVEIYTSKSMHVRSTPTITLSNS